MCDNTPGSFACVCAAGYQLVEGNCVGENLLVVNYIKIATTACDCITRLVDLCILMP